MIRSYSYASEQPGKRVLILGAVHGNEVCGPIAIQRVMAEFDSGALTLIQGQVTFVPVSNPRAHAEGKRFIERNLNRYFLPVENPMRYEDKLNNILCQMVAACDVLIDLHSTTAGGVPFASVEGGDAEENNLAAAMGAAMVVYGWHEAYVASGRPVSDPHESIGTTAYARRHGAKAVLLECGQHQDLAAIEVAYRAIIAALQHEGLIKSEGFAVPPPRFVRMTQTIFRPEGDGAFAENWGNFAPVRKGQAVATMPDKTVLSSPVDGFIVLPNAKTSAGTEWFYLGVEEFPRG